MGYVSWLGKYDEKDSVLTELLRKAGAVFYVKTSVPQTLMVCETVNNIIGRTTNPRNKNWSCGGSSGGEGAMIGLRGGIIGVGTDIGGSIRIPSAFNFLYGIRPSHGRTWRTAWKVKRPSTVSSDLLLTLRLVSEQDARPC
jgi:amidase